MGLLPGSPSPPAEAATLARIISFSPYSFLFYSICWNGRIQSWGMKHYKSFVRFVVEPRDIIIVSIINRSPTAK